MKNLRTYLATLICTITWSVQSHAEGLRDRVNEQAYLQTMKRCESIQPGYTLSVLEGAGAAVLTVGAFVTFVLKDGVSMTGTGSHGKFGSSAVSAGVSTVAAAALAVHAGYRVIKSMDIDETKRLISDLFTTGEEGLGMVNLKAQCLSTLKEKCNFSAVSEALVKSINEGQICRSDSKSYKYNVETGKFQ